ncbi:MAG TPA: metallophosphoesterase [Armatimonadota bacterium]|jgi:hypothetical protein
MKLGFIVFFGIFIALFAAINFYVGYRGWQAFGKQFSPSAAKLYWVIFFLVAFSYLIGRVLERAMPGAFSAAVTVFGSYWLGAMFYFFWLLLVVDLVRVCNHWLHFVPAALSPAAAGLAVVILVAGIMVYGVWNARHPRWRSYDIVIPKTAGSIQQLHMVMVSDIHLGLIVNNGRLRTLIEQINARNPDLVIFAGDTIDEDVGPFIEQKMPEMLQRLHPRYGSYAIFGNHEYIGGNAEEAETLYTDSGITVLRDRWVKVAEQIYLVGRDDRSRSRYNGGPRLPLAQVMQGVDRTHPIILLDHQPFGLEDGESQGADLQLSGHTHHGQMFPNNLITERIFAQDWGYLRKGAFQLIVSCGYGTWGPPIRTGNTPEALDIQLHFTGSAPK